MKNILLVILLIGFSSCDSDDNNVHLPNVNVNVQVDLNLPQYIDLHTSGGFAYAPGGIKGIIVYNTGTGYVAFDRACPHINLQDCSQMNVESIFMVCPCDGERFQLIDGAPENGNIQQAARFYNAVKRGSILYITS